MKKLFLCLVLVFSFALPAWAVNFVEIARDETFLVYLDVDSIEERISLNNKYVVAWVKWIPRNDELKEYAKMYKTKDIDHQIDFEACNIDLRQSQTLATYVYDKKGSVVYSKSNSFSPSKYEDVIPRTYGMLLYNAIMFHYNSR